MIRLGHKTRHSITRLGVKGSSGIGRLAEKSEKISSIAGTVEGIAGKVSQVAGTGATFAALSGAGVPVATARGAVSAGAGTLSKGAGAVKGVADRTTQARGAIDTINRVFG